MKARTSLTAAVTCFLALSTSLIAQERGQWRALSTTARGVTGDIAFTETKIAINFAGFTVAQIRSLDADELKAVFADTADSNVTGNLFRTEIPADKHFLHKNTLCGGEEVQWIVTSVSGKNLQLAMFSGSAMPRFTGEAMANTTALCGTYSYVR